MGDRSVLAWILIGLIVGVAGRYVMPRNDPGGFIVTILLGIAGSLFAGFVARGAGWDIANMAIGYGCAVIGAALLLVLYRVVMHTRTG